MFRREQDICTIDTRYADRDVTIYDIHALTGLLPIEITALNCSDYRAGKLTAYRRSINEIIVIPLPSTLAAKLENLTTQREGNEAMFLSERGDRLTERQVQRILQKYRKK